MRACVRVCVCVLSLSLWVVFFMCMCVSVEPLCQTADGEVHGPCDVLDHLLAPPHHLQLRVHGQSVQHNHSSVTVRRHSH